MPALKPFISITDRRLCYMALIPQDELNQLKTASEVEAVANTATQTIQEQAVAYLINTAANTGLHECLFNGILTDETITALEGKGYTVTPKTNIAVSGTQFVIGGF